MKPLRDIAICVPRGELYGGFPYAQCETCLRHSRDMRGDGKHRVMQHPPALDKQGECPSRLEMK